MADLPNFSREFRGFNRKAVTDYIDFLNNKHIAQINQMRTEMDEQRAELTLARQAPARNIKLEAELAAAKERCAELETALATVSAQLAQIRSNAAVSESRLVDELEAYRRAERAERVANARAHDISVQASGVLADATAQVDETALRFNEMADMMAQYLGKFRDMMIDSKATLRDAATAMHAIRPEEDDL